MKKALTILVALLVLIGTAYGAGVNDRAYKTLRAVSATNDSGLPAHAVAWASVRGQVVEVMPGKTNELAENRGIASIVFKLTDATGEIANWALWAVKEEGCPAEFVAYGTCTAGATKTGATNEYYANTIAITKSVWPGVVKSVEGYQYDLGTGAVTNGGIAKLVVDSCEYRYLICKMRKSTCATMGADLGTYISQAMSSTKMTDPVKTSTVDVVDAWQTVTAGTAVVGSVGDISDGYGDSILYVEVAQTPADANAHAGGQGPVVQVSYADDDWVDYVTLSLTADTAATTTTVGAVTDANTVIDLTDASTGDFDVVGRKWFIKDATIANSETVYTVSESGNAVTLASGVIRSHATGANVYDRVDDFVVSFPEAVAKVRVLWNNTDADCDIAVTSRLSKTTAR